MTHPICFSQTQAMTSFAFLSLLLVATMVSTASAQGKCNVNVVMHVYFVILYSMFRLC